MHLLDEDLAILMSHQASFRLSLPARMDFTSVPNSSLPASNFFHNVVFMIRLWVLSHQLDAAFCATGFITFVS